MVIAAMCVCTIGNSAQAKQEDYKIQKYDNVFVEGKEHDEISKMTVTKDGSINYLVEKEFYLEDKKDNYYSNYIVKKVGKSTINNINEVHAFICNDLDVYSNMCSYNMKKVIEDGYVFIGINNNCDNDKVNLYIDRYDKAGKRISRYNDKFKNKLDGDFHIVDIYADRDNVYYSYYVDDHSGKTSKLNVRCITNTVKLSSKKKSRGKSIGNMKFSLHNQLQMTMTKDGIYILEQDRIKKYSFKGKQLASYNVPKGNTDVLTDKIDPDSGDKYISTARISRFCVNNGKIYYCNRDGIYTISQKGKAKRIITLKNEEVFHDENFSVWDMCVNSKGEIYTMFGRHILDYGDEYKLYKIKPDKQ